MLGYQNFFYFIIGLLCSKVSFEYFKMLNPTMSFTNGDLERIPLILSKHHSNSINQLVDKNISLSKNDWNSFEISWEFQKHPLLNFSFTTIESSFNKWSQHARSEERRVG